MQPSLPPHQSHGNKGLWKCINAREGESDRQRGREKGRGESKQEREGDRAMLLADRYNINRDGNISLAV